MSLPGRVSFSLDASAWEPPPDLTISQWSDEYRRIPPEASAEPGIWNTSRAEYQRAMMDAVSDAFVERVVMMTAAQVGKTEILLNVIGYFMSKEPCPVLMLQPTLEMGESFSKDRLSPMIRDTPSLTHLVADPRTRDSGNTLLHKKFTGGHITIAGANSPASLASRPIRVLLCDEVDRYPVSAGTEGDPLSLAMKRTQNFWNRRVVWVSTPTLKGASRIEQAYEHSSREEWCLPCPRCGGYSSLEWSRFEYENHTEPVLVCPYCGSAHSERDWKAGMSRGQWVSDNAEVTKIRGFHVNAFASPWVSWSTLIEQYHEASRNGEEQLKVWHNTVLGLPYEQTAGAIEVESMDTHREDYDAELPEGVQILTCGVDVQDNRLEAEIVGWGYGRESWGIDYRVFYGSPGGSDVWNELDAYLGREWLFADGRALRVSGTCIDSAGHFTDEVYAFCKPRLRRNVFAIVGRGQMGLPSVSKPNRNNRRKVWLFTVGVSTLKGELHQRLQVERGLPGYCHFPKDSESGYDRKYFAGLLSERMVMRRKNGRNVITWEQRDQRVRNEPLDCRVYAMGAYEILNPRLKPRENMPETPEKTRAVRRPRRFKVLGGMSM